MAREAIYIYTHNEPGGWSALDLLGLAGPEESLGKVGSSCTPERTKALEESLKSPPTLAWTFLSRWSQGCSSCSASQSSSSSQSAKPPCAMVWDSFSPSPLIMSTRATGSLVPAWGAVAGPRPPKLSYTVGAQGPPPPEHCPLQPSRAGMARLGG